MRRAILSLVVLVAACASPPPPKRPVAEEPIGLTGPTIDERPAQPSSSDFGPEPEPFRSDAAGKLPPGLPRGRDEAIPVRVSDVAAFTVRALGGAGTVAYKPGRVTVLHVWSSSCQDCATTLPLVQALAVKHAKDPVDVIGVAIDDAPAAALAVAKTAKVTFRLGHDADHALGQRLQPKQIPTTWIVHANGRVLAEHPGYAAGDEAAYDREIGEALAKKDNPGFLY